MNGNRTTWLLIALGLAGAAYVLYQYFQGESSDGDASGGSASGDAPFSGASGTTAFLESSGLEGLADSFAGAAQSIGVGVTKGLRNHNPGNLRYVASIPWTGQLGDDGSGYAVFDTDEHGVRALGHQLQTYLNRGVNTVASVISTYAPSSENDTAAYISDVSQRMGVDPNQALDSSALPQLAAAIIQHENGVQPFDLGDLQVWVYES